MTTDKPPEFWYRLEEIHYEHGPEIQLRTYRVARHTPCFVYLEGVHWHKLRRVGKDCRKQYACPTLEEATRSYLARKKRHASILRHQLQSVEECIRKMQGDGTAVTGFYEPFKPRNLDAARAYVEAQGAEFK